MRSREQSVLRFLGKFVPVRRFSWNVLENLFKSHQETFLFQVHTTNPIEFLIISNQKTLKILICQNETGSIELNWCFYLWIDFGIQSSPFSFSSYWIFNPVKKEQLCLDLPGRLKNQFLQKWTNNLSVAYAKKRVQDHLMCDLDFSTLSIKNKISIKGKI